MRLRPSEALLHNPKLLKDIPVKSVGYLDLGGAEVDDDTLALIAKFPNLRVLDLSGSSLTDETFGKMTLPPALEFLNLSMTSVRGLNHIVALKTLHWLSLASVYLKPDAFKQLATLTNMTRLDLSRTAIQDDDLEYVLSRLPKLRTLALGSCRKLTPAASECFRHLPSSQRLDFVDVHDSKISAQALRQTDPKKKKFLCIVPMQ